MRSFSFAEISYSSAEPAQSDQGNGKKKPADGKRQTDLSHQVRRQIGIIPYLPSADDIHEKANEKFHHGNECCAQRTLLQGDRMLSFFITGSVDETETDPAGKRHRRMGAAPPKKFKNRIADPANTEQQNRMLHNDPPQKEWF